MNRGQEERWSAAFAADLHLQAQDSRGLGRAVELLALCSTRTRVLYLLGDVFDLWTSPGLLRLPELGPLFEAFQSAAAAGLRMVFLPGNRDFNFDARVNGGPPPRRLPEMLTVDSAGRRIFLTHGDLFCTGDRAYRAARGIGRSFPVRMAFSHMPLGFSSFLSQGYRRLSARAVQQKSMWEKAVDFSRVRGHLLQGHDTVICGHVHRAARYKVDLPGGRIGEFITLGDWNRQGIYLVARNGDLTLRRFD